MGPSLTSLEQIYFHIQVNLGLMLAACRTPEERRSVQTKLVEARVNYYNCVNKAFHEDDPTLVELNEEAASAVQQISHIQEQLGDVAGVIAKLTEAVQVGTKIAAKVIGV